MAESNESGGQTALEEEIETENQVEPEHKKQPRYIVMLWNDDDHTFEYVIQMMRKIFGYSTNRGMLIADHVHRTGKTPVGCFSREVAELKRDQIRAFGPDPRVSDCMSSMFASIEPEITD